VDSVILIKINANNYLAKAVSDFLFKAEEVAERDVNTNPTMERSFKHKRGLDELIALYREILKDFHKKSKQ
jgi:hypothetical protein